MGDEMQKKLKSSDDPIFGDINEDMIQSGKNLRKMLNLMTVALLVILGLFLVYLFNWNQL